MPVLEDLANTNSRLAGQLATPWLLKAAVSLYEQRGAKRQFERNPAALLEGANQPEELMTQFADAFLAGLAIAARARRALQTIARFLAENSGSQRTIGGKILARVDFVMRQLWPIAGVRRPRRVSAVIAFALWVPALEVGLRDRRLAVMFVRETAINRTAGGNPPADRAGDG